MNGHMFISTEKLLQQLSSLKKSFYFNCKFFELELKKAQNPSKLSYLLEYAHLVATKQGIVLCVYIYVTNFNKSKLMAKKSRKPNNIGKFCN